MNFPRRLYHGRDARGKGEAVFNAQRSAFVKEQQDLMARFKAQKSFVGTGADTGKFTPYQRQALANLKAMAVATKATAGNTGHTAKNTEKIERNTRKPTRLIDIDSLAIRANESRSVYMTYQSVGTGA